MRRFEFQAAPIASTIGSLASISRFTEFVKSGQEARGFAAMSTTEVTTKPPGTAAESVDVSLLDDVQKLKHAQQRLAGRRSNSAEKG